MRRSIAVIGGAPWVVDLVARACERAEIGVHRVRTASALPHVIASGEPDGVLVIGSDAAAAQLTATVRSRYRMLPVARLDPLGTSTADDVLRPGSEAELVRDLDALLRRDRHLSSVHEPAYEPARAEPAFAVSRRPVALLTPAQSEVLSLISEGYSNAQIARIRGTNVRAVEALVTRVFDRLDPAVRRYGNARVAAARAYLGAHAGQPAMAG